ncbi:MAG TPA: hypothetical protein VFZ23_08825 [Pyrinomonadaceae bacterium]
MLAHASRRHGDRETRGLGKLYRHLVAASLRPRVAVILRLCVSAVIVGLSISCSSKPTDPKAVLPSDALVYLESNDLGAAVRAVTENPKFQQVAAGTPDFSVLDGVRIGIAVTGFETSEQALTEENSVLNFQPRFVAVIETNAWGWQTSKFVENALGEFVNEAYDGAIELEITTRTDGEFYVWTSQEGRKAYALQQGSLVFFGNDESAIERCQAVKRGEAESIANNAKVADGGERLAFGYVSTDGVGQIANIAGISLAMRASEEAEVKSFVARVLPEILRNSLKDLTWSAVKTESGIEDKFVAGLDEESARVFDETLVPESPGSPDLSGFVPRSAATTTRYMLRDPQVAWRSVVLTAQKKTDDASGALIGAFAGSVFEQFGIEEPELFFSAVASPLVTVRLGQEVEDAAIARIRDVAKLKASIAKEIGISRPAESQFGAELWKSEDGELAAAISGGVVVVGDAATVLKCLEATQVGNPDLSRQLATSDAVATTVARDSAALAALVQVLAEPKNGAPPTELGWVTETRFNKNGIERRTVSDFGFIGWLIERLAHE